MAGANLYPSPYLLPASCSSLPSGCLFSLPFLLPLLDAVSRRRLAKQNHCAVEYCRRRNCRCRAEFRKFGFFCSLLTTHYSLRSRCRLAEQNYCAVQYCRRRNCTCRRNRGVEIGFSSLITHHSSLIIHHSPSAPHSSVLRGAYNPAKHHSKIAQRRAGGPQSCVFPLPSCCFLFPLLLSPVIAENLIQNCQLNQLVV